jgi:hypothetical protein
MELYPAKFSKDVIAITFIVLLIEAGLLALMVSQGLHLIKLGARTGLAIVCCVAFGIVALNVLVLFWVPRDYRVTTGKLVVMGLFRPIKEIDRSDIKRVEVVSDALSGAMRTFASGGLYGYFGKFTSERFGDFDMYSRSSGKQAVLIELSSDKKLILVPPDPRKFVEVLKNETTARSN